jgi:hypothetical protein
VTYPVTPDGRYFVVRGRLWRCSNPALPEATRQTLVNELMAARRGIRTHRSNPEKLQQARAQVQAAKVALGERGPVWWEDGAPSYNKTMAVNTPYGEWFSALSCET